MKQQFKHIFSALIILSMIFLAFGSDDSNDSKTNSSESSGPKTEFASKEEFYDFVRFYNYSDLVKKWGEADYKSKPWNSSGGTSADDKDFRITCRWNKIKVSGFNTVEVTFDVITYDWGAMGPYSFKHYECK